MNIFYAGVRGGAGYLCGIKLNIFILNINLKCMFLVNIQVLF